MPVNEANTLIFPSKNTAAGTKDLILCRIEPRQFLMGSPTTEARRSESERQFLANFSRSFWIAKYPVTQAQWQAVMGNNPSEFHDFGSDRPVENINWFEASEFASRLNVLYAKLTPSGFRFSFPTEAQWEYACRAGTTSKYFFGDVDADIDRFAWHAGNSGGQTHPVGQKEPNPWGLHDLYGNVNEWCADGLAEYPKVKTVDWMGPDSDKSRVCRGGGYAASVENGDFRSACRTYIDPQTKRPWFGFRVCLR